MTPQTNPGRRARSGKATRALELGSGFRRTTEFEFEFEFEF